MIEKQKRIMVDMSATLIHHGHIRILKAAKAMGSVIVGLATDDEIRLYKGYEPELRFEERREILEAIKYVDEVISSPWKLDENFLDEHNIDLLVHGDDNSNPVPQERLVILPRTKGVSAHLLRCRVLAAISTMIVEKTMKLS